MVRYEDRTLAELRSLADERHIKNRSSMKKAELIAALRGKRSSPSKGSHKKVTKRTPSSRMPLSPQAFSKQRAKSVAKASAARKHQKSKTKNVGGKVALIIAKMRRLCFLNPDAMHLDDVAEIGRLFNDPSVRAMLKNH